MTYKKFIKHLGFLPKENTSGIFQKKYSNCDGYIIEVDVENERIDYGTRIQTESKTTLNFSQEENWVVLECVNRILEKGYQPQNIILEKTWSAGHQHSGRLDICVTRDDGSEYLLIECKTYGKEFDKEFSRMRKNGGQLFTYFKFSNKADVIMLYASELVNNKIVFRNEIVKIEDDYRTGDVKDFHERWNKLTKDNGVFETWVSPYNFESKALTPENLEEIKPEDSSLIFNQFLEILRHNVVSDKPNAFNKMFTLFLCKIFDEKNTKPNEELAFQWFYTPYQYEGISYPPDNHISFQKRLTDLYKKGMKEFLEKEVTDISDADFEKKYGHINEETRRKILDDLTEVRLKKNNEFAIKEVFDDDSFEENAKVVKEVVELLQGYKIRYATKQQYLSDFFELLLTTGLKQESGQFFTPVPVAQFIIKSLPVDSIVEEKLQKGANNELLPHIIDYAAGSGHFVTESMHELQQMLENFDSSKFFGNAKRFIEKAQNYPYDWAYDYVYGIEKDYRLVKVGKVGCYLHGDGLAQVIHSDGLGNFNKTKEYKGILTRTDKDFPKENKQFDILVSNPPYSVAAFKNNAIKFYGEDDFELYNSLTDNSSEIECLFVERTKQLLKDGGVAGIILPSSILGNSGIYSKAREIILQYFEIVAIAELGSNTFMATGTNTVVLFLRRRNNYDCINLKKAVEKFFADFQDVTLNGVENPVHKYITHVWEGIGFDDYISFAKKQPNENIQKHELFKEYNKKIKAKNEQEKFNKVINVEQEKLFYFILAYPQQTVLVKTGAKDAEKCFLGYEFSNRRGSEGIHPIQRGKNIAECTKLFDENSFKNPEKASTYIYQAFKKDFETPVHETLQKNISRQNLVNMLSFDRANFEKNISTAVKKEVKIESKWKIVKIGNIGETSSGGTPLSGTPEYYENGDILWINSGEVREGIIFDSQNKITEKGLKNSSAKIFPKDTVLIAMYGATAGQVGILGVEASTNQAICGILPSEKFLPLYLFNYLKSQYENILAMRSGVARLNISQEIIRNIQVPLPPLEIQQQIVNEIEVLERKEKQGKEEVEKLKGNITNKYFTSTTSNYEITNLGDVCEMKAGDFVKVGDIMNSDGDGLYPCYGGNGLRGFTKTYTHEGTYSLVGRQGALCGNVHLVSGKFHATEHALVVTPKLNVDTIWLYHKLVSMNLNQYATGAAQPGLSVMNLISIQVSVPPYSKQQKIVATIEKIETQIKELEQQLAEIPKQKEAVLKKYL